MEISAVLHWSKTEVDDLDPDEMREAHDHAMVIAKSMRRL
jgi:hypothetical protein